MKVLSEKSRKEKKLMAVRGDLAERVIGIANRKGRTVYSFVNEVIEQAIEADYMDSSLKNIVEFHKLLKVEKESGAVITAKDNLLFLIEKLYPLEKEALLERWYASGRWYGKYLQIKFLDGGKLGMLERLLDACTWDSSEIQLRENGESLVLNCVSLWSSKEYTELASKFLEGIIHVLGYETVKNDVSKGLIVLEFRKKGSS